LLLLHKELSYFLFYFVLIGVEVTFFFFVLLSLYKGIAEAVLHGIVIFLAACFFTRF